MTPLRVFQAIAKVVTQATESAFGWAKVATQAQVKTGTDDTAIVTPKKFRAGLAAFGIGAPGVDIPDANLASLTGVYRVPSGLNCPTPGSYHLFHIERAVGQQSAQIAIVDGGSGGRLWTRNRHEVGTWSAWEGAWTTGNLEFASLLEAEAGVASNKIMTPLRVFQAIAKVVTQATESAFGWAKVATQVQVTTGTDDTTIITPKKLRAAQATQVEAEAGTDNTKVMTPLRVFQAIAKVVTQSTESTFGWAKLATQVQVDSGAAGDVIVTPKTLSNGVVISPGINGFEIRPKWLGGGIKQWGRATLTRDDLWIAFPMAFPNSVRTVQVISADVNERMVGVGGPTRSGFVAQGYLWGGLTADANLFVKRASAEVEIMWFAEGD